MDEQDTKRKLHTFDGAAPFNLTDEAASMKVTVNADPVPALFEMPHRDSRNVYKLWDPVPNEKFGESGMAGKMVKMHYSKSRIQCCTVFFTSASANADRPRPSPALLSCILPAHSLRRNSRAFILFPTWRR